MKKILSILIALCLLTLCLPLSAALAAEIPKPGAPVVDILNWPDEGFGWRLGNSIQFRLIFSWPQQPEGTDIQFSPDDIQFWVEYDGKKVHVDGFGWYPEEDYFVTNDYWYDIDRYGAMKIKARINWHVWGNDENNNWIDEWIESEVGSSEEFKIDKGTKLGKMDIYPSTEPVEGRPLRLGFSIPRTPEWEDPAYRTDRGDQFIAPYVQYTVTNKSTGKRIDIAPRKVSYHESRMDPWQWWDDEKQQDVYAYGANITITDVLDKGTYVVTAKAVDKRGNHDAGESTTVEFTIGDPASGINITPDKEFYELGDKATITIDAEDAKTFRYHLYAPDGNWDIDKTVKAKNGSVKITTGVLTNQEDIRIEVYQMDGIDLGDKSAYAQFSVRGFVTITPDKKEYDIGDTAKFTISAFEADSFEIECTIDRADGTKEYKFNETIEATNGTAVFEMDMEEAETVYLRAWGHSWNHWYDDGRCTVNVLDEDEKPINLKAPKNLTLKANGNNIALSWKAVDNAQKYLVSRRSGDDDYEEIAAVTDTSYIDKTAKPGVLYSYRVQAYAVNKADVEFVGPTSAEKSFVVLAKTKSITAKCKASKTFVATWKAVTGAGAYEVYYSTSKKAPKASTPGKETTTDLTLTVKLNNKASKNYYVFVRAIKTLDNGTTIYGPWSTAATVKVLK